MESFSPLNSLAGGLLIGLSATLLLWLNGRIAGVSGIANKLFYFQRHDIAWRVLFLLGLVAGAAIYYFLYGGQPAARANFPDGLLIAAGVLVGFGTALSGGCTSGHGVCGLGRLSLRSLVATLVFLGVGVFTTWIVRHVANVY